MAYTHGHHESVLRSHTWRTAENSSAYLLPHLRAGQSLLDVGCGPGTITTDLALLVAPGEVVGFDAAPEVVEQAAAHAGELGLENLRFETGDLFALPYPDESFDVVHLHQVLQHLGDPEAALVEMRRVLRPEGVLGARDSDYSAFTWAPRHPLLERWLELYLAVTERNGHDARIGPRLAGIAREPASPTSRSRARPGPTPTPSPGTGGGGCGPTASATRASPSRRSSTDSATPRSSRRSPRPGAAGRLARRRVRRPPRRDPGPGVAPRRLGRLERG